MYIKLFEKFCHLPITKDTYILNCFNHINDKIYKKAEYVCLSDWGFLIPHFFFKLANIAKNRKSIFHSTGEWVPMPGKG